MGEPWKDIIALEIGCGEGDLAVLMVERGLRSITAVDYSGIAIHKALRKYEGKNKVWFFTGNYRKLVTKYDRIVMQGVLEHLDYPFDELKWMMDNLLTKDEHSDVITSSPCFINPRGYVWMTLNMLGAVMSKTDLHFIHPEEMGRFCRVNGYKLEWETCDEDWAYREKMVEDLKQRIPLALKDGNIPYKEEKFKEFISWLETNCPYEAYNWGATAVYRIQK
jgi:SAM-dependent methyltransferase